MHQDDQYSNFACIECALKVSTSFNFMQFCDENQKLLRSPHFNVNLLVEATDNPQDHVNEQSSVVDSSPQMAGYRVSPDNTQLLSPPAEVSGNGKRRRSATPTTTTRDGTPVQNSPPLRTPVETVSAIPVDDDEDSGMALSSMLECQLDETEDVDDEEQAPKTLDLPVPLEGGLPPSNPYKCTVCFREFGKKANVLSHFQTQHTSLEVPSAWKYEIEPAKCPLCGELVECLFAHLEFHAQKRTFKCDKCEWAFYSRNYLNIHIAKLHKADAAIDAKPDRFACKLCTPANSKVCQDYDELVAHYRQWHLNEMKSKMETCQVCGKETRYLKQHMEKAHNNDNNQRQFQCHLCDKSYGQSRYLQTHYTTAHKDQLPRQMMPPPVPRMDNPQMVNLQARDQSQLAKGNVGKRPKTQPGPPVHCVKCQMQFPSNRMLNMHIQRYHNATSHSNQPTTTAEMSVTAIPAGRDHLPMLHHPMGEMANGVAKKRRRDSVPAAMATVGHPKDMWNNSALTGMLVNMFGMHGHYED